MAAATQTKMSPEMAKMLAEIEALKKANAELKAKTMQKNKLGLKVSDKGALSLYGVGRFPVTLYVEQWNRVLEAKDEITAYIEAHKAEFKVKGE